jgi:hypothetical protein
VLGGMERHVWISACARQDLKLRKDWVFPIPSLLETLMGLYDGGSSLETHWIDSDGSDSRIVFHVVIAKSHGSWTLWIIALLLDWTIF